MDCRSYNGFSRDLRQFHLGCIVFFILSFIVLVLVRTDWGLTSPLLSAVIHIPAKYSPTWSNYDNKKIYNLVPKIILYQHTYISFEKKNSLPAPIFRATNNKGNSFMLYLLNPSRWQVDQVWVWFIRLLLSNGGCFHLQDAEWLLFTNPSCRVVQKNDIESHVEWLIKCIYDRWGDRIAHLPTQQGFHPSEFHREDNEPFFI